MKYLLRSLLVITVLLSIITAAGFIILKRGVQLETFTFSNFQVEQFRLELKDRLNMRIGSVIVQTGDETESTDFDPASIRDAMHVVDLMEEWFDTIRIDRIEAGQLSARFVYHHAKGGELVASSKQFNLDTLITRSDEIVSANIRQLTASNYNSRLQGSVQFDTEKTELSAALDLMLADTLPLAVNVNANAEKLDFSGHGKQPVSSIGPIVGLFDLGPGIAPWIDEYLVGSSFTLQTVSGSIPYDDPAAILNTLHAHATVTDTEYTFEPALEPIKARSTDVEFINAVLHIKPSDATFYGQDAGSSHLDINFNDDKAILTAYIKTEAQASGGILTLLDHYGIPFPFVQKSGLTDTDLTLVIDLDSVDITAKGRFKSKASVFKFDNTLFNVTNLDVMLDTTDIRIEQLGINSDNLFSARIQGDIDAAEGAGELNTLIDSFSYSDGQAAIRLANANDQPLSVNYRMSNDGDEIQADTSQWDINGTLVSIGAIRTPFDHSDWSGSLPPTPISIPSMMKAEVSGNFQRTAPYAELDANLLELSVDTIQLKPPAVKAKVIIGDAISITSLSPASLSVGDTSVELSPSEVSYQAGKLDIAHSALTVDGKHKAIVTGVVDLDKGAGDLHVDKLRVMGDGDAKLLTVDKTLKVRLSPDVDSTRISIPAFSINATLYDAGGWSASVSDLGGLHKHSSLLQQYLVKQGSISLNAPDNEPLTFEASLNYPHALLVDGDVPVYDYAIAGSYSNNAFNMRINDSVQVTIDDTVTISLEQVGISVPGIVKLAEDVRNASRDTSRPKSSTPLNLSINAKDSFLWLDDERRIMADKFNANLNNGVVNAELKYADGRVDAQFKDEELSVVGNDLGKDFLNPLITLTDFDKGTMEIQVSGGLDDLSGVVRFDDAVIKNYKTLNNILAFIDTIPSLLTFRVPDYNKKGLPAKEILLGFHYGNRVLTLKSLTIDSSSLDLRGEGVANFNDDTVDMKFNLITSAGKNTRRIPLLGYVLAGSEKSPSITVEVTGNLDDPMVKNTAFKEVATYPFQVLKNTVTLPGHLTKKVKTSSSESQADQDSEPQPD